jgi:hypothetical protein
MTHSVTVNICAFNLKYLAGAQSNNSLIALKKKLHFLLPTALKICCMNDRDFIILILKAKTYDRRSRFAS